METSPHLHDFEITSRAGRLRILTEKALSGSRAMLIPADVRSIILELVALVADIGMQVDMMQDAESFDGANHGAN